MQINELPSLGRALQSGDQLAVDDANGVTYKVGAENINPTPAIISIPTSRWSGSGSDYYITVTASNVTADSILIPQYDVSSAALLNGPVWCVPAAGSFTIHTSAKPSGTVTILVLFPGTMGAAHYEVLADVYSKSQVDSIVAQSTAVETITFGSAASNITEIYGYKSGNVAQVRVVITGVNSGWNNDINIGLSAGLRPKMIVAGARQLTASANGTTLAYSTLAGNGTINVWANAALTTQLCFSYTYIIGN